MRLGIYYTHTHTHLTVGEMTVHRNISQKKSQNLRSARSCQFLTRDNLRFAKKRWLLSPDQLSQIRSLTEQLGLSVASGELTVIEGKLYVTHAGLLRIARRGHCSAIRVRLLHEFSDPLSRRWIFKAIVKTAQCGEFTGYGDADPSNVSPLVRGAEMRIAETRAVNRALRKAYGIGLCSVEELGWAPKPSATQSSRNGSSPAGVNRNGHSTPPRLRDRLCLLVREHQLDPTLVKAYAADYCGTPALHNATREQVETFINHLTERATNDRAALLCHLNSFAKAREVSS
jgi:hypothetical protein